jgi:DNA mismatch endonuclease (patch repair protein)
MADIVDTATRSRMMAGIRGQDTKPEMAVRRALHAAGLRFRLHAATLQGRPDIVLPSRRLVIFVHGCFWHRHPGCRYATIPTTRPDFWRRKFEANQQRDAAVAASLSASGWKVMIIWECETKDPDRLASAVTKVQSVATVGLRRRKSLMPLATRA